PAGELVGDAVQKRLLALQLLEFQAVLPSDADEVFSVDGTAPKRVVRDVPVRPPEVEPVRDERGAHRAAGVAGGARHEHGRESRLAQDPRVRPAIQGHTAAETEVLDARLALQPARQVDEDILEHELYARCDVRPARAVRGREIDRLGWVARRTERLHELLGEA